ncbi:MAG: hypothetical protein J6T74_09670 [Clostridia bacterium]|nr:hypothetical protein [Clostridia bacterium]
MEKGKSIRFIDKPGTKDLILGKAKQFITTIGLVNFLPSICFGHHKKANKKHKID